MAVPPRTASLAFSFDLIPISSDVWHLHLYIRDPTRKNHEMKLTAKTVHEHPTGYKCWISRKADLISQNIKNQKQEVQRLRQS